MNFQASFPGNAAMEKLYRIRRIKRLHLCNTKQYGIHCIGFVINDKYCFLR